MERQHDDIALGASIETLGIACVHRCRSDVNLFRVFYDVVTPESVKS
jgi:hypothetical protein